MNRESKSYKIIQKLADDGWVVDEQGNVITPKGYKRKLGMKNGYRAFTVSFEGSSYPVCVHQLSAYLKFGEKVLDADCIRHYDGDRFNNGPSNLKLGSHSENAYDRCDKERLKHSRKAAKVLRRFTDHEVRKIRKSHESINTLASRHGCARSTISAIMNRKVYKEVN